MKLSDMPPPPLRAAGFECAFAGLADVLDDDDRATLAGWLAGPDASDSWVAERLTEAAGYGISHQVVARHRRDHCMKCKSAGRVWV